MVIIAINNENEILNMSSNFIFSDSRKNKLVVFSITKGIAHKSNDNVKNIFDRNRVLYSLVDLEPLSLERKHSSKIHHDAIKTINIETIMHQNTYGER
jgi:hypothetical protein